jgi:hypothetical protein
MNLPPSDYPDIDVDAEVRHQRHRFQLAGLVLPNDWEVWTKYKPYKGILTILQPLHQEPIYYIRGGTSDSEAEPGERRYKSELRPTPKPWDGSFDPIYEAPALVQKVSVTNSTLLRPRVRSQWESINTIRIDELEWRLEASSTIAQRDKQRRVGNVDHNQTSKNKDSWPQTSIPFYTTYVVPSFYLLETYADFEGQCEASSKLYNLSYRLVKPEQELFSLPAEVDSEYRLGDAIANIIACDLLPISRFVVSLNGNRAYLHW